MFELKKIDKLVATSFVGPAVLSFFVAEFVLIMQFLWKYIDEILGKGFTIPELLELILYYGVTLIPLAVPITVLISSVMVFGDMSEKYELSSMKSAGISLFRVMLPGLIIASLVGFFSIFSSNYLKPASNLQFQKRFLALRKQKSALAIEQGIFNDAFNDIIIRVSNIEKNGRDISDVLIYDHSAADKSMISFLSARKGQMFTAEEGKYFVMKLDSGIQYRELERKIPLQGGKAEIPFMRTYFDEWVKTFDMSVFDLDEGILNFNARKEDMMNTFQILQSVDSFKMQISQNEMQAQKRIDELFPKVNHQTQAGAIKDPQEVNNPSPSNTVKDVSIQPSLNSGNGLIQQTSPKDTITTHQPKLKKPELPQKFVKVKRENITGNISAVFAGTTDKVPEKKLVGQHFNYDSLPASFISTLDSADYALVVNQAIAELSRERDELVTFKTVNFDYNKSIQKYHLRLHQQYSWAFICIIFLFIGAPMGSIIRKGGYGYPFLVAILFYMLFIISTIMGEKLVKSESLTGVIAAWMPCMILLPFSITLSVMALKDIRLNFGFVADWYYSVVNYMSKKEKVQELSNP